MALPHVFATKTSPVNANTLDENFDYLIDLQTPNVMDFGAVGDGTTDDTAALIAAFAAGSVIFPGPGFTFLLAAGLTSSVAKAKITGNHSTIKLSVSFNDGGTNILRAINVTAADVEIEGLFFDGSANSGESLNNQFVSYASGAHRGKVRNCRFLDLANIGSNLNAAVAFLQGADECESDENSFLNCPGSVFTQGAKTRISQCRSKNPKDVSYALNSTACVGSSVTDCKVYNDAGAICAGHILAEEGASGWQFVNNYVYGVKNGIGIGAANPTITTVVEGGLITGNIIDGGGLTSTNPAALISVPIYYKNTRIDGNQLRGMPAGLAANAAIVAPFIGTSIARNRIDATTGTSSAGAIILNPSASGSDCYLDDNDIDVTGGPSRHVVVGAGSNGGGRLSVKGGRFLGGSEGINFNLNSPTAIGLWIENIREITATSPVAVSTALAAFGDRQVYINTHNAEQWPHIIKANTVMYGNAAPTTGTWAVGDEVIAISPSATNPDRWRCVTAGTSGTWKAGAALAA